MTTRAHIKDEWERDMVGIAVVREHGPQREVYKWTPVTVATREADTGYREETEEDRLHLRVDDARAIYEALADYFGHAGHDARALRRDYDAERKRVDLLIGNLIGGAR